MTEYIFERHRADQELARLQMIEEALDPATIEHLKTADADFSFQTFPWG